MLNQRSNSVSFSRKSSLISELMNLTSIRTAHNLLEAILYRIEAIGNRRSDSRPYISTIPEYGISKIDPFFEKARYLRLFN